MAVAAAASPAAEAAATATTAAAAATAALSGANGTVEPWVGAAEGEEVAKELGEQRVVRLRRLGEGAA